MTKAINRWRTLTALLLLTLAGLSTSPASAHYSEACWVKFSIHRYASDMSLGDYSGGRWPVYSVQCNYLTGQELNARAGTQEFANDRVYVVIVWPNWDRSYIRISQPMFLCGAATEPGCAERISGRLTGYDHGYDRYGRAFRRTWQICQSGFIGRDCSRM